MTTAPLISPHALEQLQAQAKALGSHNASPRLSPLSGPQRSSHRGSGVELQDLRGYEFGDDVRHMAWRSSAKTGRPMVKVFHAEKQARRLLCVEQYSDMYFATAGELKAATAVRAAALLCFNGLFKQAQIGGLTWGQGRHSFPYSHRLEQTLALLRSINLSQPPQTHSEPQRLVEQLCQLASQPCDLYLISDFNHWQTQHIRALGQLTAQHTLYAIQIIDRGEQSLVDLGKLRISSPGDGGRCLIDTRNAQLRQRYNAAMRAKQEALTEAFKQTKVEHLLCYTHADILPTLAPLL